MAHNSSHDLCDMSGDHAAIADENVVRLFL